MSAIIKVKAYAVLLDRSRTRHAVWVGQDATKNPSTFHRLLGGHVEFGERAADAAVREIEEELGTSLVDAQLLGVMESIFDYQDEPRHEVAFVYAGSVADGTIPTDGGWFDDGGPIWVEWRDVGAGSGVPLYPDGVQALIHRHLAT